MPAPDWLNQMSNGVVGINAEFKANAIDANAVKAPGPYPSPIRQPGWLTQMSDVFENIRRKGHPQGIESTRYIQIFLSYGIPNDRSFTVRGGPATANGTITIVWNATGASVPNTVLNFTTGQTKAQVGNALKIAINAQAIPGIVASNSVNAHEVNINTSDPISDIDPVVTNP